MPQTIGIVIKFTYYGCSTILIGMTLSLTIAYFNIQSSALNTDHLTGINNRRHLDEYVAAKIRSSTRERTFAAIKINKETRMFAKLIWSDIRVLICVTIRF